MKRISKHLNGFREPLAGVKRRLKNAELALERLAENSRPRRAPPVIGAGYCWL